MISLRRSWGLAFLPLALALPAACSSAGDDGEKVAKSEGAYAADDPTVHPEDTVLVRPAVNGQVGITVLPLARR